jgi:hypothetical protein
MRLSAGNRIITLLANQFLYIHDDTVFGLKTKKAAEMVWNAL